MGAGTRNLCDSAVGVDRGRPGGDQSWVSVRVSSDEDAGWALRGARLAQEAFWAGLGAQALPQAAEQRQRAARPAGEPMAVWTPWGFMELPQENHTTHWARQAQREAERADELVGKLDAYRARLLELERADQRVKELEERLKTAEDAHRICVGQLEQAHALGEMGRRAAELSGIRQGKLMVIEAVRKHRNEYSTYSGLWESWGNLIEKLEKELA